MTHSLGRLRKRYVEYLGLWQVTGTRRWLARLGLPVVRSWRPWRSGTGQIGGYYERYSGLTFLTIRDAGHMASAAALSLFQSSLFGSLRGHPTSVALRSVVETSVAYQEVLHCAHTDFCAFWP